jgi:hypothetical protein
LAGDQFLRIAELERTVEDLAVGQVLEARQHGANLGRDGMMALAVPAQIELRLLAEVFEIGHGRNVG